jgi:hypothetical protein
MSTFLISSTPLPQFRVKALMYNRKNQGFWSPYENKEGDTTFEGRRLLWWRCCSNHSDSWTLAWLKGHYVIFVVYMCFLIPVAHFHLWNPSRENCCRFLRFPCSITCPHRSQQQLGFLPFISKCFYINKISERNT